MQGHAEDAASVELGHAVQDLGGAGPWGQVQANEGAPGDCVSWSRYKLVKTFVPPITPHMRDLKKILFIVYDGRGQRPQQPVHVVVPELMGNIQCRVESSDDTGLMGLLERFIPPYTSPDPESRDQQAYGLCAFIGIHNYRLVVDYLGGCPGLTFISTEPGVSN